MMTRKSRLGIPTDDPITDAASGSLWERRTFAGEPGPDDKRALGIVDFRIRVPGDWMSFMTTPRTSDALGNQVAREVFTGLPRRYDRLAWLLSLGQDRRWRRSVVGRIAAGQPRRVLDVATGPAGEPAERRLGGSAAGRGRAIWLPLGMDI